MQEAHAVHAASLTTGTLRSLFMSLSHGSFGKSGMNQYARRHRGALMMSFCIESELKLPVSCAHVASDICRKTYPTLAGFQYSNTSGTLGSLNWYEMNSGDCRF